MHRVSSWVCLIVSLAGGIEFAGADDVATLEAPHWIWVETPETAREVHFVKSYHLDSTPVEARLQIAADFCDVVVEVNGERVIVLESFAPTQTLDVTPYFAAGENRVDFIAAPDEGPTAVALTIDVADADGNVTRWNSDDSWTADFNDQNASTPVVVQSLGTVTPSMWGIDARSIEISPFDDYEQWRRASGDDATSDSGRFWIKDGFEIEVVKEAGADEGSWVALAFDESGRLTVAREDRGLLRFSFNEPGGHIVHVETFDDELEECRGLVYDDDTLYANANNSRAVYRLQDVYSDAEFDLKDVVREFPGGVGHGRNQLAVAGGALWSICGDSVEVPDDMFDRTSPFREARRGQSTSEGFLARFDLETKEWELFCAGLRNPFGIAFNREGEAFTYDADAEYDMGTPWYRPTRLLHLQSGADYGWRGVTGTWPPYDADHPDNAQPILDIGKGSPTSVDFGYDSHFPSAYREALYILDWAYGRVLAVHLTPRGGTFRAQAETFLQGSPLNVTGIDFGPDGAMYLVTGGRSTKSALYRVRYVGESTGEQALGTHDAAMKEHAAAMSAIRHQLENWHGQPALADVAFAMQHLGSPDPSFRFAAQTALEHLDVEAWRNLVLDGEVTRSMLVELQMLARSGEPELTRLILRRLLEFKFEELNVSSQLMQLHTLALCRTLDESLLNENRDALLAKFDSYFPDTSDALRVSAYGTSVEVERELARLLVDLDAPGIVERCVNELERSTAQEDRLHYLFLLRDVETGWSEETHRVYFTALQETDGFLAGEGMPKFLDLIREAALERLDDATRLQLASLLERTAIDEVPAVIDRPLVNDWTFDELVAAVSESDHVPSIERGAEMFQQALCARCHRAGARGPAVGPDLTHVRRRFTRDDILRSIVLPNLVIAENYRNLEVITTEGRIVTGRAVTAGDYRSSTLRIAVNPLRPSEIVELSKEDVEISQLSGTSPMPADLLNTFTVEEIIDLLAYVMQGGE